MATKNNTDTAKGKLPGEQKKSEAPRIPTITPDNENGDPGPPAKPASKDKTQK